jgi:hypothetical protein
MLGILRACCLPSSDSPGAFGEAHEAHNEALHLSAPLRGAAGERQCVRMPGLEFC